MAGKPTIRAVTIQRGRRKGQRILAYVYPSGKYTEIRGKGRGATVQRRRAARAAGLRDRFGHTAEDRARIRRQKAVTRKIIKRLAAGGKHKTVGTRKRVRTKRRTRKR